MSHRTVWRRVLSCAAIDVLLIATAATAMAAPAAASAAPELTPALPTLLLLGVGLCRFGMRWRD